MHGARGDLDIRLKSGDGQVDWVKQVKEGDQSDALRAIEERQFFLVGNWNEEDADTPRGGRDMDKGE